MALQQPALPVGAAGMGGFLALRPPTIVPGLNRRPESVLAFGLNAKAQGPNQSGR